MRINLNVTSAGSKEWWLPRGGVGAFWVEVIDNVMFEAIFDALMARLAACLCVFGCMFLPEIHPQDSGIAA